MDAPVSLPVLPVHCRVQMAARAETKEFPENGRDGRAAVVTDVAEVILADHRRIGRLFAAFDDVARDVSDRRRWRDASPERALNQVWSRIATFLDLHADAEQEVCYLVMFAQSPDAGRQAREAVTGLDSIRESLRQARNHDTGSQAWWRAVCAARRTSGQHREAIERGALADFRRHTDQRLRDDLGRQWDKFTASRGDLLTKTMPQRGRSRIR
jgi:hypothetical protein